MDITVFTDPGCPFGFNAQRQDLQLLWHYGHAVTIDRRMIVLSEVSAPYEEHGYSREDVVRNTELQLTQGPPP